MMVDVVVDLSHWQSVSSFSAMRSGGIQAVILKATQGSSWVDPIFVGRVTEAKAAGLLVGAYHFADASSPVTQAANFLTLASAIPMLALDIEPNGMGDTVSIAQAAEIVARIQMVTGKLPLVYIGRYGPSGNGAGLPNSILSRCPLWLPEYGDNPVSPSGWDAWTLWQYTEAATVAGINGTCDRSRFNGTPQQLSALWGA